MSRKDSVFVLANTLTLFTGFGRFHWFMAIVFGWANSADSIEMLSISYVLPQASCEFKATDLQLGFLTAVGFAGNWNTFFHL